MEKVYPNLTLDSIENLIVEDRQYWDNPAELIKAIKDIIIADGY